MADVIQKYLKQVSGVFTEVLATISGGSGNENKLVQTDGNGLIDISVLPADLGSDTVVCTTSEALSAGDFVNLYDATGTLTARKADASSAGKEAHGYVLSAVTSGDDATVYRSGKNGQVTGATLGQQFLSDVTPGAAAATSPTTANHISQKIGFAISATAIESDIEPPIVLA